MKRELIENKYLRWLYLFLGFIFLGFGVLGILLPVIPGLVFVVVSTYFFSRSSHKFHDLLINNKYVGKYVRDYYSGVPIPLRTKILAVLFMVISLVVGICLL
ncbi:MAG: YbaN family protein [Ignavibacteria bacterium]|nr:YbaN family protein [Ignavibacteria bacterium]